MAYYQHSNVVLVTGGQEGRSLLMWFHQCGSEDIFSLRPDQPHLSQNCCSRQWKYDTPNAHGAVGGETLTHEMQSHQLRSTCVKQSSETLLKNYTWRGCQSTLVRIKLGANKDVLLGICVHDS